MSNTGSGGVIGGGITVVMVALVVSMVLVYMVLFVVTATIFLPVSVLRIGAELVFWQQ